MSRNLASVRGKVFCQPSLRNHLVQFDFVSHGKYLRRAMADRSDVIAGDRGDNAFCTTKDGAGAVWFWDHETDDTERLAGSIAEFVVHCIEPPPVRLDPKR